MKGEQETAPKAELAMAQLPPAGERRSRRRARIYLPVYVRPTEGRYESFDDVRTTLNASSDSVYFTSWQQGYCPGMRVMVTFPFSPVPSALNVDYIGQVVRIDQLSDGRLGIAVFLLTIIHVRSQVPDPTPDDPSRK
jgi:hypothetical protein